MTDWGVWGEFDGLYFVLVGLPFDLLTLLLGFGLCFLIANKR